MSTSHAHFTQARATAPRPVAAAAMAAIAATTTAARNDPICLVVVVATAPMHEADASDVQSSRARVCACARVRWPRAALGCVPLPGPQPCTASLFVVGGPAIHRILSGTATASASTASTAADTASAVAAVAMATVAAAAVAASAAFA